MTEEIIQSITQAEAQAAEIKKAAQEKAAREEKMSEEVCKAYRETQIKNAETQAQADYDAALQSTRKQAREYCARIMDGAKPSVSKIVGRIVRGDR